MAQVIINGQVYTIYEMNKIADKYLTPVAA